MNDGEDLTAALSYITQCDPDFETALTLIKPLPDRSRPAGFEYLTKIIIEQQVSLASADAIWTRMIGAVQPFTPEVMLGFTEQELRDLGLSRQKAKYCHALAEEVRTRRLVLEDLHQMEDEQALEQLIRVKGIGRWTAEIYLMACLGRTDIWPAGDVALQSAMGHLKNHSVRPTVEVMDELAEPLRPYRTVAARILWRYYADVVQTAPRKKTP
ncbi:MAG: DNA-3-methyladenine glycosylase [Proteobacteria bacterium]|nr:DNA-3-methyladenine glycosylase [Pseudomonadota bacterium]